MARLTTAFIFGNGGHARVIASILHGKYTEVVFVDRTSESRNTISEEIYFSQLENYAKSPVFIGIGDNAIREKLFLKLKSHHITPENCIAEHAFVAHDANLGQGIVICPGAVIGSQATIQDNCVVNTLSSVDHDCMLGAHSQITAGVNFGGNTRAGKSTFFGMRSATVPNVTIGDNAVIMAGSLVCNDIPANVMVGGIPAKIVKKL